MGGLGSMVALLVTPQIRSYSRMSVPIAFMALFAVAILLERWGRRLGRFAPQVFAAVTVLGLLDQTTPVRARSYHDVGVRYRQDAAFVHDLERTLPRDAMVFQLPYAEFPEASRAPGRRIGDYDMLQPYFHSTTLRWSYPTMMGRPDDAWYQKMSLRPAPQMIAALVDAGFAGILITRRGFPGIASAPPEIEVAIQRELGATPQVTGDGWFAFFDLREKTRQTHAGLTADEIARRRDLALHPTLLRFRSGCFETEYERTMTFRWCSETGEIEIDNDASVPQTAALSMTLASGKPPARLTIFGDLLSETVEIPQGGAPLARTLSVAPGHHRLRYHAAGAPPPDAQTDPRRLQLIWRAENPRLEEIPGGGP
jgi:phosphoglycerol transferase